jgi:hypothetical protein
MTRVCIWRESMRCGSCLRVLPRKTNSNSEIDGCQPLSILPRVRTALSLAAVHGCP